MNDGDIVTKDGVWEKCVLYSKPCMWMVDVEPGDYDPEDIECQECEELHPIKFKKCTQSE